jgi:hypothetical protein
MRSGLMVWMMTLASLTGCQRELAIGGELDGGGDASGACAPADPSCVAAGKEPPQAKAACLLLGGVRPPRSPAGSWLWPGSGPAGWILAFGQTMSTIGEGPNIGSLNGALVLVGEGTWTFFEGWQEANPTTSPQNRQSGAVATLNDKVLLFGGCLSCAGSSGVLDDTWEWDGQTWTELYPAQSPPARFNAVAGTVAGKIVLFGGESAAGTYYGDTWEWDGQNWAMATPMHAPSARTGVASAVASETLVLFGGASQSPSTALGDTWTWDGSDWTELTLTTAPAARRFAQMGSLRGTPVLFGGTGTEGQALGDTWTWSGTTWIQPAIAGSPPPNSAGALGCF